MELKKKVQDLISKNDVNGAFAFIKDRISDQTDVLVLENQWQELRRQSMLGIIPYSEENTRRNRIVHSLLLLSAEWETATAAAEQAGNKHDIKTEIDGLEKTIGQLIEKKNFLESELILAYDAEKKYALKEQIKEIDIQIADRRQQIVRLKRQADPQSPAAAVAKDPTAPKKIFFSYSQKDREYLDQLLRHLSVLRRQGKIQAWDDQQIPPGEEWDQHIKEELAAADIILLLVSADFLNTDYIWDIEIEAAMARHERGEVRVIPIILRPCAWEEAPFSKLNGLPTKGKPVSSFEDRDEAWLTVVKGIKGVIEG